MVAGITIRPTFTIRRTGTQHIIRTQLLMELMGLMERRHITTPRRDLTASAKPLPVPTERRHAQPPITHTRALPRELPRHPQPTEAQPWDRLTIHTLEPTRLRNKVRARPRSGGIRWFRTATSRFLPRITRPHKGPQRPRRQRRAEKPMDRVRPTAT